MNELNLNERNEVNMDVTISPAGPKGDTGDCNFASFYIKNGHLIMRKTKDMFLKFKLDGNKLKVVI